MMHFGVFIPQGRRHDLVGIDPTQHWGVMAGLARRADGIEAWSSLWVSDHVEPSPEPTQEAAHEAWTMLAAFAGVTGRIRLGLLSTSPARSNPARLAKVAATVDVISEGRLDVALGVGGDEGEWRAYGYAVPPASEHGSRLAEEAEILTELWTSGRSTFTGRHYTTDGALCFPRPVQGTSSPGSSSGPVGGIPLWIAGSDAASLATAVQHADAVILPGNGDSFAAASAAFTAQCVAAGRDPASIVRAAALDVVIGRDEREIRRRLAGIETRMREGGVSESAISECLAGYHRDGIVGTPGQVCTRLAAMRDDGLAHPLAYFPGAAYDPSGMELFEREVIPEFTDPDRHSPLWHVLTGR